MYKIVVSQFGNAVATDAMKCEVLVESESDLAALPENLATGSMAYTADFSGLWMKNIDGTWKTI